MTGLTKKWDAANEFISLMSKHKQSEAKRLATEFNAIIEKMIQLNRADPETLFLNRSKTIIIKIDKHELSAIDRDFRREFIKNGQCVHLTERKLENGKYHYEVRYRSDAYTITAESDYLDEAKQKFLEMTKTENIKRSVSVLSHGKEVDKVL